MNIISIEIDDKLLGRLKTLSTRTKKSESFYIRQALENFLEDLEDIAIAKRELEKIKSGEAKVISNEEALKIIYGSQK